MEHLNFMRLNNLSFYGQFCTDSEYGVVLQRLILSGVNSGVALRMTGRGSSVPRGMVRGGLDRGRGRGRGRGEGGFYREDDSFGRGRPFNRSESWDVER